MAWADDGCDILRMGTVLVSSMYVPRLLRGSEDLFAI